MKILLASIFSYLIEFISNHIGLVLSVIVLLIFSAGYFTKVSIKFSKDIRNHLKTEFPELKGKVNELSGKVDAILAFIPKPTIAEPKSPLKLNESGEEISKSVEANEIVKNHLDDLKAKHTNYKELNPYKIQTICMSFATSNLKKELNEDELDRLEQVAFDKGLLLLKLF